MCEVCEQLLEPKGDYFICDNCGLDSNQICEDCHREIENVFLSC